MSKSNNRKGNSARGRTADSCKGVTLSAEGEHKGGGSTKVESRSGSVKPAERGATVGSAQARKSEENIPSGSGGTAPNGYSVSANHVSACSCGIQSMISSARAI
jgi:hypothetical protein